MKVTLVAHVGAHGGIATQLNQLASALRRLAQVGGVFLFAGDDVEVDLTHFPSARVERAAPPASRRSRLLRSVETQLNFLRELRIALRHRGDLRDGRVVLSSHQPSAFWGFVVLAEQADYFLYIVPPVLARAPRNPATRLWSTFLRRLVERRLSLGRLRLFALTPHAADRWAAHLGVDRATIRALPVPAYLHHPCDSLVIDRLPHVPAVTSITGAAAGGLKIVLSAGHVADYKNPVRWLELAKHIHGQREDIGFVWAGDGALHREMREAAEGFPRIFLPGRLNRDDLAALYEASWAFFHPAVNEAQGIVIMDALTFGLPVLLNDTGALPELIAGSDAGILLPCEDETAPQQLAGILERLSDEAFYDQLSGNARALAADRYSYDRWINELRKLW